MAGESKNIIIIKKVKKSHGGHHGGSWKVAYADFVTAMMAFFLLLWLISMVSDEKRAAMSMYFKNFSLFDKGGKSLMIDSSSIGPISDRQQYKDVEITSHDRSAEEASAKTLAKELSKAIEEKLAELRDQVLIDRFEGGVRIQIVDKDGASMFPSGSAVPNPRAIEILQVVAEGLKHDNKKIAVEGHTDSAPFRGGQITNWELSTSRASAARIELEKCGIAPNRIARVVGYADTDLLIKNDPLDARNRRMSIIVLDGGKVEQQQAPQPITDPALTPGSNEKPPQPEARNRGGARGLKSKLTSNS